MTNKNVMEAISDYHLQPFADQNRCRARSLPGDRIGTEAKYISSPPTSTVVMIARVLKKLRQSKLTAGFDEAIETLDLDFLFVDTHPGMNQETLMSIAISDWLILILRPDRQDYLGTAVTIEVSRKLGVPNLLLVVNKVLASMDQATLRKDVERSFAAELGAVASALRGHAASGQRRNHVAEVPGPPVHESRRRARREDRPDRPKNLTEAGGVQRE